LQPDFSDLGSFLTLSRAGMDVGAVDAFELLPKTCASQVTRWACSPHFWSGSQNSIRLQGAVAPPEAPGGKTLPGRGATGCLRYLRLGPHPRVGIVFGSRPARGAANSCIEGGTMPGLPPAPPPTTTLLGSRLSRSVVKRQEPTAVPPPITGPSRVQGTMIDQTAGSARPSSFQMGKFPLAVTLTKSVAPAAGEACVYPMRTRRAHRSNLIWRQPLLRLILWRLRLLSERRHRCQQGRDQDCN
jgi:hypothetical protein